MDKILRMKKNTIPSVQFVWIVGKQQSLALSNAHTNT